MAKLFSFLLSRDFYIGILRYGLALIMIGYGVFKMKGYQGAYLTPGSSWQLPLEALNGRQLIWAFVGYKRWFQFLLGFLEFLPACLLLFRRTALLGAVLMLPMTVGVFLVNYALDLWRTTKTSSLLLLLANIAIILLYRERLKLIMSHLLARLKTRKYLWLELAVNIAIIAFMCRKLFVPLYHGKALATKPFCGDCFNRHPNEWILVKETQKDSILPLVDLRCYFTPKGTYAEINDENRQAEYLMYRLDEQHSRLSIQKDYHYWQQTFLLPDTEDTALTSHFTYTFTGDSLLQLQNDKAHTWLFRRRVINKDPA